VQRGSLDVQVRSLGQELAKQAICVPATAALPETVLIATVHTDTRGLAPLPDGAPSIYSVPERRSLKGKMVAGKPGP